MIVPIFVNLLNLIILLGTKRIHKTCALPLAFVFEIVLLCNNLIALSILLTLFNLFKYLSLLILLSFVFAFQPIATSEK